ncbi:MAG: cupin domain-containing protein [Lachnospiraceae bacterium]|nr:cupin domain-containing protein [Lachnospiraceae bacterium]
MIIKFIDMEEKANPQFKGGLGETLLRAFDDEYGKIMLGKLEPGCSIGLHTHETNSEIIYIVQGRADYIYDKGREHAEAGDCHYCPKGHSHSMINNGDEPLIFFAVVR